MITKPSAKLAILAASVFGIPAQSKAEWEANARSFDRYVENLLDQQGLHNMHPSRVWDNRRK